MANFATGSVLQAKSLYFCRANGEMAERSNAAVLKTVVPVTEPGVRIPLSPHSGEMAERSNAAVSKTVVRLSADRGFESPSLREFISRDHFPLTFLISFHNSC